MKLIDQIKKRITERENNRPYSDLNAVAGDLLSAKKDILKLLELLEKEKENANT